jgi:RNA polymerase sigma factor (TIGR02999 family)
MGTSQDREDGAPYPEAAEVYDELHAIAQHMFRRQHGSHTLQATALVNEAWLRMAGRGRFEGRSHFLGVAAKAMRHVLVDHARRGAAEKRGGDAQRVTLATSDGAEIDSTPTDVLDLERALEKLEREEPRQARVVELRFYGGLTIQEIAAELGVSHMTVSTDWRKARSWLARELDA